LVLIPSVGVITSVHPGRRIKQIGADIREIDRMVRPSGAP
jgi:hypothetical protein